MTSSQLVYEPGMWPHLVETGQREGLCEWLRANGIAPDDVPISAEISIEPFTLGGDRAIRYTAYLRNAEGHKYHDEDIGDAAQEERITPLVTDPPAAWHTHQENDR